ncbi:hypothetical protein ELE36_18500 [Pseudolysobacter antarcticus]|uniref:Transmembrane protein n=1 Tax=Pseudolysobacter antarcticus TaxID=2511995 RepID=A0A411HNY5_9GAMM|nr:hypothetical protein [Pseudolysobacter antarcticus]QBB72195.1 hypothetical protein ELE36_18500 [Pseudolysobacter antarcticus]
MDKRTKSRLQLVLVAAIFAAPLLIALALNQAGWRPHGTRNFGELVTPPQDMNSTHPQQTDGGAFVWHDTRWQWTLLAVASNSCENQCLAQLDLLHRARLTLNQNSDRVRLVYSGPALPAAALEQLRPITLINDTDQAFAAWRANTPDTLAAALVDPSGFLMLRYTAGFDANGLKKDLTRLIH